MAPDKRAMVEQLHPLQLTGACLVADRLEFRYRLEGRQPNNPGRITRARLIGPAIDVPLTEAMPGGLQTAIPELGGKLTLRVDAAEGCAESVPPLPWHVELRLPPEALEDYVAAEPTHATADLPEGVLVLRRAESVVLFWDGYMPGSDFSLTGDIQGHLLAGVEPLMRSTYRFARQGGGQRKLRPGPKGKAPSVMQIEVHAVEYVGENTDGPLVWVILYGSLGTPWEWRVHLSVPPERPVALAPDLAVGIDGLQMALEEVWLARSQTVLLFNGGAGALDVSIEPMLEDENRATLCLYRGEFSGRADAMRLGTGAARRAATYINQRGRRRVMA